MSTRAVNKPSQSFTITEKAPTRYLSLASVGEAQRAVCCSFLMSNTLMLLTGWLGLVMYAAYQHCDPITAGQVNNTAVYSLSPPQPFLCKNICHKSIKM